MGPSFDPASRSHDARRTARGVHERVNSVWRKIHLALGAK